MSLEAGNVLLQLKISACLLTNPISYHRMPARNLQRTISNSPHTNSIVYRHEVK